MGVRVVNLDQPAKLVFCSCFVAHDLRSTTHIGTQEILPGVGVDLLPLRRVSQFSLTASHRLPSNHALVIGRGLYPGEYCMANNVARQSPKETPY
jgi:hypothetical protein